MIKNRNTESRFTPLDKDYPSCDDVYVDFFVYCDFETIKDRFPANFIPTDQVTAGKPRVSKIGKIMVPKISNWTISSDKIINSKDARDHIDYVLDIIYPQKEHILKLQEDFIMSMKCVWFAKGVQTVYIRISDANGKSQTLIANTIHPFFANGRWTAAGSLKTRLTIFRLPFCVNTNTLPL